MKIKTLAILFLILTPFFTQASNNDLIKKACEQSNKYSVVKLRSIQSIIGLYITDYKLSKKTKSLLEDLYKCISPILEKKEQENMEKINKEQLFVQEENIKKEEEKKEYVKHLYNLIKSRMFQINGEIGGYFYGKRSTKEDYVCLTSIAKESDGKYYIDDIRLATNHTDNGAVYHKSCVEARDSGLRYNFSLSTYN